MADVFGQKLATNVSFDLIVEEPFVKSSGLPKNKAELATCNSGENEEVNGDGASPTLRRPRLSYDLELGLKGHIVEAQAVSVAQRKNLPRIPISSINVPTYGLGTTALTEWSTIQWLNNRSGLPAFRPLTWFTPLAAKNSRAVRSLDLGAALGNHPTGTAVVSLLGVGQLESQDTLINVTDLGLSARMSKLGSLVWVTRLSTGGAVAAATVTAYGSSGETLAQTVTDDQGLIGEALHVHPSTISRDIKRIYLLLDRHVPLEQVAGMTVREVDHAGYIGRSVAAHVRPPGGAGVGVPSFDRPSTPARDRQVEVA